MSRTQTHFDMKEETITPEFVTRDQAEQAWRRASKAAKPRILQLGKLMDAMQVTQYPWVLLSPELKKDLIDKDPYGRHSKQKWN